MTKPRISPLLKEFILLTRNAGTCKGETLTVDRLKEELAIWREATETRREGAWKAEELDQIEAELTALRLDDETPLSEIL